MNSTGSAGLRGLRALVFGTAVLLLSAGAHVLAGGGLPSLPVLVALGIPVGCASVVLARRSRRLPVLLGSLAAAQVVLHEAFMSTSAACAPHSAPTGAHHAVAAHCEPMTSMVGSHAAPSALMVLLHVVATVAAALLLARGERLVTRLAVWARDLLTSRPRAQVGVLAPTALVVRVVAPVARLVAATDVSRRGPPALPAPVPVTA